MKKRMALILAIIFMAASITTAQAAIPTTSIVAVVQGESVTIRTIDFPANHTFHVLMGYNGTHGINGYLVSKITTGEGGSFLAKFYIPEELADEEVIAIRLESVTDSQYYSFDWFYNKTGSGGSDTTCTTCSSSSPTVLPVGFPTFDILSVARGASVTVQTRYFPTETRFAVFMKDGASAATTWYEVAGIETAESNSQIATFTIPDELQYKEKIAVKFYNMNDGFITYNLFNNYN